MVYPILCGPGDGMVALRKTLKWTDLLGEFALLFVAHLAVCTYWTVFCTRGALSNHHQYSDDCQPVPNLRTCLLVQLHLYCVTITFSCATPQVQGPDRT